MKINTPASFFLLFFVGALYALIINTLSSYAVVHSASPLLSRTDKRDWSALVAALVDRSDVIVYGQVINSTSHWDPNHTVIETDHEVAVLYTLTGKHEAEITVQTDGGFLIDEGLGMRASDTASFTPGDEVLLFLKKNNGYYQVVQGEAGKFTILTDESVVSSYAQQSQKLDQVLTTVVSVLEKQQRTVLLPTKWRSLHVAPPVRSMIEAPQQKQVDPRWPGPTPKVPVTINLNSPQVGGEAGSNAQFMAALQNALRTWSVVAEAEFTLLYNGTTTSTSTGYNGKSEILFMSKGYNTSVGQAQIWFTTAGDIIEADIWVNNDYTLNATGNPPITSLDLESVVLHELGYWVPIGSLSNPNAVMYPVLNPGTRKAALHSDDIAWLVALYPCPAPPCIDPAYGDTETPSVTPPTLPTTESSVTPVPTTTPTNLPTSTPFPQIVDSGFRPNPDGFSFENTGVYNLPPSFERLAGWYPNALQSIKPTYFFGDDVCSYTVGENCILRWDVANWRKKIVDDAKGGFCLGMALDSIFYWRGMPRPQSENVTYRLSYNDAVPSIINSFAWQYVPEISAKEAVYRSKNVTETLQLIQTQLSQGIPIRISLRNDPPAFGHAVVGYKLETLDSNTYRLWMYDNSYPQGDHFAIFNPKLNTATYEWPNHIWNLVRAIPISVYSDQYTWHPRLKGTLTTSPEISIPIMLVVPANTTVLVNGVVEPIQYIETGLGYATSGTVLIEPGKLASTTISIGAAITPMPIQAVAVFGGGKALDVSGLNPNDVIKLADTLQSVSIKTQQGSSPSISLAGDIIMGNSEATISTSISSGSIITVTLTDVANLSLRNDRNTLQAASIEMKVLQPMSKTNAVFVYSDLFLSSATAVTFTLGTAISGMVDYSIERPFGNIGGTLVNQFRPLIFLPLIRR